MKPVCRIAVHACSSFAKHVGALATAIAVICVAGVCPLPCGGQTTPWNTNGSNWYSPPGVNVGIGTTNPLNLFHAHVGTNLNLGIRSYQNSAAIGAFNDVGNLAVPMNFDASSFSFTNGNVGIGTTAPQYKLSVSGTIGAKEVIVTNTGWSDYVFKPDYRLKPLKEIAAYIKANHHLPGIPSEADVREKGVSVGEMQAKLLAKVEELTMHMIQAEERNDRLEGEVRQLRSRLGPGSAPRASRQGVKPQNEARDGK
jgi:hypothetical protein